MNRPLCNPLLLTNRLRFLSAFGTILDNRNFGNSPRVGYQGSEKDNEIKGDGNSYTTEYRILDTRLGRWLSIDPEFRTQPWASSYLSMNNNPIWKNDPNGDVAEKSEDGKNNGPEDKPADKGKEIEVSKGNEGNPFRNDPIHGNTMLPSSTGGAYTQMQTSATIDRDFNEFGMAVLGGSSTKEYRTITETIKTVGYQYSKDGKQITIVTNTTTTTVDLTTQLATMTKTSEISTYNVVTAHQITGLSSDSFYEYETTGTVVTTSTEVQTKTLLLKETSSILQERVNRSLTENEKVLNSAIKDIEENIKHDQFDNVTRSAQQDAKSDGKIEYTNPPKK